MPVFFVVTYLAIGFALGYLIRLVMPHIASPQQARPHNLSLQDRLVRFSSGIALLVFGVYFSSSLLLLFAGFSFFEATARWCVVFALLGKSSCPL